MENPYLQYFTGEKIFEKRPPIDSSDFSKFRKRIGSEGSEVLFRISLCVNAKELTEEEDITLRRTYTREMKALKLKVRFMNHPRRKKFRKRSGIEPVIGHI